MDFIWCKLAPLAEQVHGLHCCSHLRGCIPAMCRSFMLSVNSLF